MANILEQEWHNYFMQLNEMEKKSVVLMLKAFLQQRNQDTGRISLEQYNKEIDEALAEVEAGNYITQEEMEKRAAKW
jgi:predicted transcriptional regulator